MIIYPDLELRKGRLVNLVRNRIDSPLIYDLDPVQAARDLAAQGAEWLHVVDLDAVFNDGENTAIINEIIQTSGCLVQVGGAIRSMEKLHGWMEAGASRVVIATAAVKYPHLVKSAATAYPGSVVVSVDARGGRVVVEGWTEATSFTPIVFAHQFENIDLAAIIYTDIDRDEDRPESTMAHTTELASKVRIPVIASGVVKTLDDISTLSYLPNIAGVITSRALFGGAFTFREANAFVMHPRNEYGLGVPNQTDTHSCSTIRHCTRRLAWWKLGMAWSNKTRELKRQRNGQDNRPGTKRLSFTRLFVFPIF